MSDKPLKIERSTRQNKKYVATLPNGKRKHFGDSRYGQFKDLTPVKAFKSADHGDPKRREAYFSRHGKAAPKNSAKWLSHKFLWGG